MRSVHVVALILASAQTFAQCDRMVNPVDVSIYTASDGDFRNGFSTLYRGRYAPTDQSFFEGIGSHPGVDITHDATGDLLTTNSAVNAICAGEVVRVTHEGLMDGGWGNSLTIRHDVPAVGVVFSAYAHLDRFARPFKVGDEVTLEQLSLGYVGTTGASTGVHLHFQVDTTLPDRHPFFPNRFPGTADATLEVDTPDADLYVANRTQSPLALVQRHSSIPSPPAVFSDSFEQYVQGTFPSSGGWSIRPGAGGTGDQSQFVTKARANSGTQSFQLSSAAGLGINVQKLLAPLVIPLTHKYAFEASVNTTSATYKNVFIGFATANDLTAGVRLMAGGGFASADLTPIAGSYSVNTWIRLRVVIDPVANLYDVNVNGTPIAQRLPVVVAAEPTDRLHIAVDNSGVGGLTGTTAYFDDISLTDLGP